MRGSAERLRVAVLAYRGNPHSGGQGVYTRYLSRELTALGHHVEVFSGPPYPLLDEGVGLVRVPSMDLYRQPDPFRVPWPWEFRSREDLIEFAIMCSAGFPEPLTFSLRVRKLLERRRGDFDLLHDNQCLGRGLLPLMEQGFPLMATVHHPITVDRDLEMAHATGALRRLILRRWYGFVGMQLEVARHIPRVVTVSETSRADLTSQMGIAADRVAVVPVGVDHLRFRPMPEVERVPGRLMTTASADVPMKGLVPLLEALAKVRTERQAELVVVGRPRSASKVRSTIERLGLSGTVRFVSGVSDQRLVELYAEAELAVVPSLYEGFSLPAVEAMACGVPVVATTGGALPEVVGTDGVTGLLVPPGDPGELALAISRGLEDPLLRARLGQAGRRRVLERFTWRSTAVGTLEQYGALIEGAAPREARRAGSPA